MIRNPTSSTSIIAWLGAALALSPWLGAGEAADLLEKGKVSLNFRARYEGVEQTALRDADALTLRTRLGFTTGEWSGLKAMVEAENIVALDGDRYSQAGLNPAATGRAVVADPETTEVNQVWLSYTQGKSALTLGRQRLVLDNARFVGDVGWRQNMQTFDAVVVQDKSLDQTTLTYAYLDQINRVFSRRHAQGRWDSESHLFNASRAGLPGGGTLTGYGYLLDFENSAANSCATWGASYAGTVSLSAAAKLAYRAECATQSDYGSSRLNYQTTYYVAEAGLVAQSGSVAFGYEVLGSDNNVGFKTPLATLHAYNGWADLFLTTPAAGLRNPYLKATATLPEGFALTAAYHWYETDATNVRLGREFNAQLTRKFGKNVSGLVKFADFRRDSPTLPTVRKVWLQVEFAY
jgi:hypothetical protein